MAVKTYRKTALVTAEQFLPAIGQIPKGVYSDGHGDPRERPDCCWVLDTKEGRHTLRGGDYICTGPAGEQWNVAKEIFEATYEEVETAPPQQNLNSDGCTCHGCGATYRADLLVPDDVWAKISPSGAQGGLLCPTCVMHRITDAGIWTAGRAQDVDAKREAGETAAPESHLERTFQIGGMVRKRSGSWWEGRVVGFYRTEQTPDGVCVQLDKPMGPVQIYPASALATTEGSTDAS